MAPVCRMWSSVPTTPASNLPESWRRTCGNLTFRARYEFRAWCGCRAPLFASVYGRRSFNRRNLVRPESDLCIEGFPRSANSYTVVRVATTQGRRLALAHHLHVPAQLQRAAEWNVPALLLIRHPREAAASMLIRHPELTPGQVLRAYSAFYRALLPLRDHFVLGEFGEVTRDLGSVIARVNRRFETSFIPPGAESALDLRVFRRLEYINQSQGRTFGEHAVSRPSRARAEQKRALIQKMTEGRLARLLIASEEMHAMMLERCDAGTAA